MRNHAIKMVFMDYDGTLVQGGSRVPERTREAFRKIKALGITPVICTGSSAADAAFAIEAIGADEYLVADSGQEVYRNFREKQLLTLAENSGRRHGVKAVMKEAGVTKEQVMVIGNSEKDLGMFEEAGIRVAMNSACPEIREMAHYFAPDNVEEGVAWALETLILKEREEIGGDSVQYISHDAIEDALKDSRRQYLAGNLSLPQTLPYIFDTQVECGITSYSSYHWETAHYHTTTTEYAYMIAGETKYVDLSTDREYYFREGDFYVIHKNVPYIQKSKPGCRLLFFKAPGLNDKCPMESTEAMEQWCKDWDIPWMGQEK